MVRSPVRVRSAERSQTFLRLFAGEFGFSRTASALRPLCGRGILECRSAPGSSTNRANVLDRSAVGNRDLPRFVSSLNLHVPSGGEMWVRTSLSGGVTAGCLQVPLPLAGNSPCGGGARPRPGTWSTSPRSRAQWIGQKLESWAPLRKVISTPSRLQLPNRHRLDINSFARSRNGKAHPRAKARSELKTTRHHWQTLRLKLDQPKAPPS